MAPARNFPYDFELEIRDRRNLREQRERGEEEAGGEAGERGGRCITKYMRTLLSVRAVSTVDGYFELRSTYFVQTPK